MEPVVDERQWDADRDRFVRDWTDATTEQREPDVKLSDIAETLSISSLSRGSAPARSSTVRMNGVPVGTR